MRGPGRPLFLGRKGYRARRLRDAARLLPVLGLVLLLLPMLWAPAVRTTVADAIYVFVVWVALIVAAAALAPWLRQGSDDGGDDAL